MWKKEAYDIAFKKLSNETHTFEYLLEDSFFEGLEDAEIKQGDVDVQIQVIPHAAGFNVRIDIEGSIFIPCDRCLDDMEQWIEGESDFLFKFGENNEEDDIIYIPEESGTLNMAWLIYETIVLLVPLVHTHDDGECNKDMLERLEAHLAHELHEGDESTNKENNQETDPRWDGLKNIIMN